MNNAIGVFDSGLGGLTAVTKLRELLPKENIVYFGDTARLPYGSRSRRTIIRYAKSDLAFLMTKDIKAVLIACGTVSSNALHELEEAQPTIPIVGVVEASADEAAKIAMNGNGRILVLGTSATIGSGKYQQYLNENYNGLDVISRACPMFVPLVENNLNCGDLVKRMVAKEYLQDFICQKPAAIILGCTHYILLADIIKELFPNSTLVDSGEAAAKRLTLFLEKQNLLKISDKKGKTEYFVSDASDEFLGKAVFLNEEIDNINLVDIESF